MKEEKFNPKQLRRSQTITPFGVGSIIDIENESLVAADIWFWKGNGEEIHEPRLEKMLGVKSFKMAVAAPERITEIKEDTLGVPFVRFPAWMFCPTCRLMSFHSFAVKPLLCSICPAKPRLTPMRFVMACPFGHLCDLPWDHWAHRNKKTGKCEKPKLRFITKSGGSGLDYVYVHCESCNASSNLAGITGTDSLKAMKIRCPGLHPWESWEDREKCDAVPQVLQRGATNLTFAVTASSLDIPPHSLYQPFGQITLQITNHPMFAAIRTNSEVGGSLIPRLTQIIADSLDIQVSKVESVIRQELHKSHESDVEISDQNPENKILSEEYAALLTHQEHYDRRDRFIRRDVDLKCYPSSESSEKYKGIVSSLKGYIGNLVQVVRLREVRVLRGFTRLGPLEISQDEEQGGRFSVYGAEEKICPSLVPADLGRLNKLDKWLPGVEVFGEGIFLVLNEKRLMNWESESAVQLRVKIIQDRRNQRASYLPESIPRLLLLHTLSHMLIRELSAECGYSAASIRERIYSGSTTEDVPMAGILLYTAAGDSEGTLGGLVRQGEPERFIPVLLRAIQAADWCSSDPLCRESSGQGLHALNLAACHACTLLPETSCSFSNRLLDRVLLTGSTDGSIQGYFTPILRDLRDCCGSWILREE